MTVRLLLPAAVLVALGAICLGPLAIPAAAPAAHITATTAAPEVPR